MTPSRGIAYLTGRVSTRSGVGYVIERVEDLDGVVGVDSSLTWDFDDVVVPPVAM